MYPIKKTHKHARPTTITKSREAHFSIRSLQMFHRGGDDPTEVPLRYLVEYEKRNQKQHPRKPYN
jgi:hypothetical protein